MLADTLTKPLSRIKFEKFRKELGVVNDHFVSEGEC
jgi:hypothetical protein